MEDGSLTRHGTAESFEPPKPTEQERNPQKPFNVWAVARLKAQRPLGEWLGVVIYSFIGLSANLAAVTSQNEAGTLETGYWAWGFATMIGESAQMEGICSTLPDDICSRCAMLCGRIYPAPSQ